MFESIKTIGIFISVGIILVIKLFMFFIKPVITITRYAITSLLVIITAPFVFITTVISTVRLEYVFQQIFYVSNVWKRNFIKESNKHDKKVIL